MSIEIVTVRKSEFSPVEERDHVLRIRAENVVLDVTEFEWDHIVTRDLLGKTHVIRHARFPVRQLWKAIDAFGKPTKAIESNGKWFWIQRAFTDDEGKIRRIEAGNSIPFTVSQR